jgi:uncharacterized protein YeaO (DUF488 family)
LPGTDRRRHEQRGRHPGATRYQAELAEPEWQAAVRHLRELARSGPLTLLTATRDLEHSQAAVLARHLRTAP